MSSVFTTKPSQGDRKPGQLSDSELDQFFREGFVVVKDVFTDAELSPMKDELDAMVDEVAQRLYKAGKIKDLCSDEPHETRLTALEAQFPGATVLLHKIGEAGPHLQRIWTQPRLLNIVEQLVGPNVVGHAVWNIRPKAPGAANHDVPWHQDNAYMTAESNETLQITGWIPLLDTNANNGCLEFLPRAHSAGVGQHEGLWKETWYIHMNDTEAAKLGTPVKEAVVCEVPYGSLVLFTNMTPHRSLPNLSNVIRWSLDLRWQAGGKPTGFSVKDPIWFRKDGVDVSQPDWDAFNSCNRQTLVETSSSDPALETTINPELWMRRWPLTHTNKHSDAWKREERRSAQLESKTAA